MSTLFRSEYKTLVKIKKSKLLVIPRVPSHGLVIFLDFSLYSKYCYKISYKIILYVTKEMVPLEFLL